MIKISIIGLGTGNKDFILPIAKKEIEKADCLVGAKRLLSLYENLKKEEFIIEGNYDKIIPFLKKQRENKKIAVLVSGDPGLFSLAEKISKSFKKNEFSIIPGISTLQLAFARIGESWNDAKILSIHGRDFGNIFSQIEPYSRVLVFLDNSNSPKKLAKYLLDCGLNNRDAIIFENLSYRNERITRTSLKNLGKMKRKFESLCAIIIKDDINNYLPCPLPLATCRGKGQGSRLRPEGTQPEGVKGQGFAPRKLSPRGSRGKLYGIGIGPGDPKLLTLRAKEILNNVDAIFAPRGSDEGASISRSIVEAVLERPKKIIELTFPMTKDKSILNKYWNNAAMLVAKEIKNKKDVAFVTIGDPFIYSTYNYLLKILKSKMPEMKIETIPGISSINASASRINLPLVERNEKMAIIPAFEDEEKLKEIIRLFDTVVIMKIGSNLHKILSILKKLDLIKKSVLVNRLGYKDEKIIKDLSYLKDKRIGYLSVMIVKK